jgi:hypothetical protein
LLSLERQVTHVKLDVFTAGNVKATTTGSAGSRRAVALGTRFVDANGTSIQLRLVHLTDSVLGGSASGESNESETTGALGVALNGQKDFRDRSKLTEFFAELVFIRGCNIGREFKEN